MSARYYYFAHRTTKRTGKQLKYNFFFKSKKEVSEFLRKKREASKSDRFRYEYERIYRFQADLIRW